MKKATFNEMGERSSSSSTDLYVHGPALCRTCSVWHMAEVDAHILRLSRCRLLCVVHWQYILQVS